MWNGKQKKKKNPSPPLKKKKSAAVWLFSLEIAFTSTVVKTSFSSTLSISQSVYHHPPLATPTLSYFIDGCCTSCIEYIIPCPGQDHAPEQHRQQKETLQASGDEAKAGPVAGCMFDR